MLKGNEREEHFKYARDARALPVDKITLRNGLVVHVHVKSKPHHKNRHYVALACEQMPEVNKRVEKHLPYYRDRVYFEIEIWPDGTEVVW